MYKENTYRFLEKANPAGGIFSTANDMAEYMLFHLRNGMVTHALIEIFVL